ncbi:MAG: isoprenylcysteine carboxylmethyltransferase family protein [Gemmatimonadetes bacterium]|nr:isoprenylcysteine carboxylmethyltransferase family protein [Gemmatimonadota bacterium]
MSRRLDLRKLRLRAVWLLILPFYIFAAPAVNLLWWGAGLSAAGLALRAWAAGSIRKDRELATTGPYAHTRNPLYLGSFMLGTGVTLAGGLWVFGVAFLVFFSLVYRATVRREATELEARFGESYTTYVAQVPAVFPRITGYQGGGSDSARGGFSPARYLRNREWEAARGAVAAFGLLALKLRLWL